MKFAELVVKAGFPPGVVNILPGKGNLAVFLFVHNVPCVCVKVWCYI